MSLQEEQSNTAQTKPTPSQTMVTDNVKKLKLKELDVFKGERPKMTE